MNTWVQFLARFSTGRSSYYISNAGLLPSSQSLRIVYSTRGSYKTNITVFAVSFDDATSSSFPAVWNGRAPLWHADDEVVCVSKLGRRLNLLQRGRAPPLRPPPAHLLQLARRACPGDLARQPWDSERRKRSRALLAAFSQHV
eukprot:1183373-Prorocentrum_minimum.AAC.1